MYVEERLDAKPRKEKAPREKTVREKAPSVPKPPKDRAPRLPTFPDTDPTRACAIVGVVIGLLACGATWLSLQGCEAIRGTSSCGGPGFLVLLVILVLLVLAGSLLLRMFRVPESPSTSFLAVGLLSMLTLLILTNWIFEWWMVLIIPPLAAACYVVAQFVTSTIDSD